MNDSEIREAFEKRDTGLNYARFDNGIYKYIDVQAGWEGYVFGSIDAKQKAQAEIEELKDKIDYQDQKLEQFAEMIVDNIEYESRIKELEQQIIDLQTK